MTVALIGPPAAGKSRIGRRLAKRLRLPFVDTDTVVATRHGDISRIFAEHGEPVFRHWEREAVVEALEQEAVVSLGGGAVLDERTRDDLASCRVVLLEVTAEAVAQRIQDDKRPLVTDLDSWRALVESRRELYESLADYRCDTSERSIDIIVSEIATWLKESR
ncbi:shikimate kinase [Compostimonas suwonensis]|uniref:Shikimate kinase n=1 Tax=Compostimonas suwonensis TaxID=1048394 RepID=A0A2M9BYG7_9MICO|nr:shikimate kinase [Compostimonas suwonensis]PJJ63127.1 shikimate kinase [Compostimonas suwonensis]